MAAVQRTRIGYGNEGRTEQLAASLSDLIRLFSLYPPSLPLPPQQHNTTHKSLVVPSTSGGSFFNRDPSGSFLSSHQTHRLTLSLIFGAPSLSDPTFASELYKSVFCLDISVHFSPSVTLFVCLFCAPTSLAICTVS